MTHVRRVVFGIAGLLVLLGLVLPLPVWAQLQLDSVYTAVDNSFQFRYPGGWALTAASAIAPVEVVGGSITARIYGPTSLAALGLIDLDRPQALARAFLSTLPDVTFQVGSAVVVDLGDRQGVRMDFFDMNARQAFLVVVPFRNGTQGLIDVRTHAAAMAALDEDTILALAASLDSAASGILPPRLPDYAADWLSTVHQLEDMGLIPTGGRLIFNEDRAFLAGQGSLFTPLAQDRPQRDYVLAGWLTFIPSTTTGAEVCALGSRISLMDNRVTAYLAVGINNQGQGLYADHALDPDAAVSGEVPLANALRTPHHFLVLAREGTLSVYVDGQLTFDQVPVEARLGIYGLGLTGQGSAASCVGDMLWAFEIPAITPGVCEISVPDTVNQRSGPGVGFEAVGQLAAGTVLRVEAQAIDGVGYTWWRIDDGYWVREDVVTALGDCRRLPFAE